MSFDCNRFFGLQTQGVNRINDCFKFNPNWSNPPATLIGEGYNPTLPHNFFLFSRKQYEDILIDFL